MKKIFLPLVMIFLISGCLNEREVKEITEDLSQKKREAVAIIIARDLSTENLLKAQEYFFSFGEKVHLLKEDPKALERVKSLIKNKKMKEFCDRVVMPLRTWNLLEDFCKSAQPYRCSPDIKAYKDSLDRFLELVGPDLAVQ